MRVVSLNPSPEAVPCVDMSGQGEIENGKRREVFIVEKDIHVRKLLVEFLSPLDCHVWFFEDGYIALDMARRNPPRLIITEILVTRLDGLALCRLIKGDASLASVKVLVLTFLSAEDRARVSRADAFLKKPIQRQTFLQSVHALIGASTEEQKYE